VLFNRGGTDGTAAKGSILLITFHHIAVDLWSLVILLNDFRTLYRLEASDPLAVSLEPVKHTYLQFSVWQRAQPLTRVWEDQATFWEVQAHLPPLACDRA
jgi:hypothetical protein